MQITAVRQKQAFPAGGSQVIRLDVKDISSGGLCGLVGEELARDEELTVLIPPVGGRGERDVRGRVTRCERGTGGYVVGLAFRDASGEAGRQVH
jgi:hypothetical protein